MTRSTPLLFMLAACLLGRPAAGQPPLPPSPPPSSEPGSPPASTLPPSESAAPSETPPPAESAAPPAPDFEALPSAADTDELFRLTPIADISLDLRTAGRHPAPQDLSQEVLPERTLGDLRELRMEQGWGPSRVPWEATNFWHHPLYYEDVLLERHGQTRRWVQPACSAAHFFASTVMLPYKIGLAPPCERVYTLGYGRPGSCKPPMKRRLPLEADAAALEAGAIVGLIFLIP